MGLKSVGNRLKTAGPNLASHSKSHKLGFCYEPDWSKGLGWAGLGLGFGFLTPVWRPDWCAGVVETVLLVVIAALELPVMTTGHKTWKK